MNKTIEQLQKEQKEIALKYLESISKKTKAPEPKATEPPKKPKAKPESKLHYFIFLPVITTFIILATPPNWYN